MAGGSQAEGLPSLPGESFQSALEPPRELYKILVGSRHPQPLHENPRVTPRHRNFYNLQVHTSHLELLLKCRL